MRDARRSRRGSIGVAEHFPQLISQSPPSFPTAPEQDMAWGPDSDVRFSMPLNLASTYVMDQTHPADSSLQGSGLYQSEHTQPLHAGLPLNRLEWTGAPMRYEACFAPPPDAPAHRFGPMFNTMFCPPTHDGFSQHIQVHPISHGSIIHQPVRPLYDAFNQTFSPNQSHTMLQPIQSTRSTLSLPASPVISGSETLLEADNGCNCGPNCLCEGCVTHFNNTSTRNLVGDLRNILVKDHAVGQYKDQSVDHTQISSSPIDVCPRHTTVAEASPGNLPSPADSISEDRVLCDGVNDSELSEFAGEHKPVEPSQAVLHYLTVEYPLDSTAEMASGSTEFGSEYPQDDNQFLQPFAADPLVGEFIDLLVEPNGPVNPKRPSSCCRK